MNSLHKPVKLRDMQLLHDLAADTQTREPMLNPRKFERSLNLQPIPTKPQTIDRIQKVIEVPDGIIPGYATPESFRDQVSRLLSKDWTKTVQTRIDPDTKPKELSASKEILQETTKYVICRSILGGFPRYSLKLGDWLSNPVGLNRLAAALFTLQFIVELTGDKINWKCIHEDYKDDSVTEWSVLNLRPDGPLAIAWQSVLSRIRCQINVLKYPPVIPICTSLSEVSVPKNLTGKAIGNLLSFKERKAAEINNYLSLFLTERFLLSASGCGLRYRYVLRPQEEPRTKRINPRAFKIDSKGLVSTSVGFAYNNESPRCFADLQVSLEPIESNGPNWEENETVNFTVDTDNFSFRLDLFTKSIHEMPWQVYPWHEPSFPENASLWLKREVPIQQARNITYTQAQMLGFLLAHHGSFHSRMILRELLKLPDSSYWRNLNSMNEANILTPLYHPALELSGLPQITIFMIKDASAKIIEEITTWFMGTLPCVHLRKSRCGRYLVAYLFLPLYYSVASSMIHERLVKDLGVDVVKFIVRKQWSYYMTFPSRLYDTQSHMWADPWEA